MTSTPLQILVRCIAPTLAAVLMAVPGAEAAPRRTRIDLPTSWYAITTGYRYDEAARFERGWHRGADVQAAGSVARAVTPGVVRFAGVVAGRRVVTVFDHAGAVVVTYVGLDSIDVRIGDLVQVGDRLARADSLHVGAYDAGRRSHYLPVAQSGSLPAPSRGANPTPSLAGDVVDRLVGAVRGEAGPTRVRVPSVSVTALGGRSQPPRVVEVPGGRPGGARGAGVSSRAGMSVDAGVFTSDVATALRAASQVGDRADPRHGPPGLVGRLPTWVITPSPTARSAATRRSPVATTMLEVPRMPNVDGRVGPVAAAARSRAERSRTRARRDAYAGRRGGATGPGTSGGVALPGVVGPSSSPASAVSGAPMSRPPSVRTNAVQVEVQVPTPTPTPTSVVAPANQESARGGRDRSTHAGWSRGWPGCIAALLLAGVVARARQRRRHVEVAEGRGSDRSGIELAPLLLPTHAMTDPDRVGRRAAIACSEDPTSEPRTQLLEHA